MDISVHFHCMTDLWTGAYDGCSASLQNNSLPTRDQTSNLILQEYLAQWVAKAASAEKDYCSATDQMNRPSLLAPALPQAPASESSGVHLAPAHALHSRPGCCLLDAAIHFVLS